MNIAVVGNGPVEARLFDLIERTDFVVRFNAPPPAHEYRGMRTDRLVIANSAKQTQELLASPAYLEGPVFSGARSFLLPHHPDIIRRHMPKPTPWSWLKGRRADLTAVCERAMRPTGKPVEILDPATYVEACEQLDIPAARRRSMFPSSGMLAIVHALRRSPADDTRIHLFGFGFAGWKRHDWPAERRFVEDLIRRGRVVVAAAP